MQARHILIAFAEDGEMYRHYSGLDDGLTVSLILTHGGAEGSLREKLQGEIDDAKV